MHGVNVRNAGICFVFLLSQNIHFVHFMLMEDFRLEPIQQFNF